MPHHTPASSAHPEKRVGIVIVTTNCLTHLPRLFTALGATATADRAVICVVDNASTDGCADYAETELKRLPCEGFVVRNRENLGFCGGNNMGVMTLRRRYGVGTYLFLNPDTAPQEGWLEPLLEELKKPGTGSVSSLLLLPDGTVNSLGNAIHFLGFGFTTGYGEPATHATDREVLYGTGAAVAVSAEALESMRKLTGRDEVFWDELFLYDEDQDLGWRLALAGLFNRVCARSRVVHHSTFVGDRPRSQGMLYLERNRWLVMLANFRLPTVFLLLPFLWGLELLQFLGWRRLYAGSRWRIYQAVWAQVLRPEFWRRRTKIQRGRIVSDREILRRMESSIRHGAMKRRPSDPWIDRLLAAIHRALVFCVRW